jgi:hypothetical protein
MDKFLPKAVVFGWCTKLDEINPYMGVHILFSVGVGKNILFAIKVSKKILVSQNISFSADQRGQEPPCLPLQTPMNP